MRKPWTLPPSRLIPLFVLTLGTSLAAVGGCAGAASGTVSAPKKGTVKYEWLQLTVSPDGEHVVRAEIDPDELRQRGTLVVEVRAGDLWIDVAGASKKSILAELGTKVRHQLIEDERVRELYHGADQEVIFLGGSFAFQGDELKMVALLDGSDLRIGGRDGKIIHIECERSAIDEILGEPMEITLPTDPKTPPR